jgi:hypothetical protein
MLCDLLKLAFLVFVDGPLVNETLAVELIIICSEGHPFGSRCQLLM